MLNIGCSIFYLSDIYINCVNIRVEIPNRYYLLSVSKTGKLLYEKMNKHIATLCVNDKYRKLMLCVQPRQI